MALTSTQGTRKRVSSRKPGKTSSLPQAQSTKDDKKAKSGVCREERDVKNTDRHHSDQRKAERCDIRMLSKNHAIIVTLLVTLVTVVGRVYYVTLETSWWVLHPDEIYQAMEVAYSEIYGYGLRPYEFLPPIKGDNLTQYQQWEQMHGMYALRSPLFPWFYVFISWLVDVCGGSTVSPYLVNVVSCLFSVAFLSTKQIWRTGHVILASLLPWAAHILTSTLTGSHEVGVVAALLVTSSVHLTVLGTHTIVHSFLAPVFFLSLAGLHSTLLQEQGDINAGKRLTEQDLSGSHLSDIKHTKTDSCGGSVQADGTCEKPGGKNTSRETHPVKKSRDSNSLATLSPQEAPVSLRIVTAVCLVCGFCVAICCYIRPDSVLFISVFFLPFLSPSHFSRLVKQQHYFHHTMLCIVGAILGVVVGVCCDFYFYDVGVLSPVNWFRFNVLSNATAAFFGTESSTLYCWEVFFRNSGMVLLLAVNVAGMITSIMEASKLHHNNNIVLRIKLLGCILLLLGMYSLQAHKELRFIHHELILYFVFTAVNISSLAETLSRVCVRIPSKLTAFGMILLFACSQWQSFPTPTHDAESLKSWVYLGNTETYDITRCVNYIASQKDVRGVYLHVNMNMMGGFTLLRHNVPLFVLTSAGYHEYGMSVRHVAKPKLCPCRTNNVSLATAVKVSNHFDFQNKPYMVLHLIWHKEYNYLLLATGLEFLPAGYKEVFDTGQFKVLKRVGTKEEEKRLKEVVPLLRAEPDGSVLKREASQLFAFGLKDMAAQRFKRGKTLEKEALGGF